MLAGDVPFEADSAVSVALMQLQADAKRLTDINPDIPLGLEQICIRAMQKDPAERYQTATEMLFDIEEVIKNPSATFNYNYSSNKLDANPTKIMKKGAVTPPPVVEEPPVIEEIDDEYEDPERKKKVVTAVIIGIIVLVAAAVLLILGVMKNINTTTYTLENFVGNSWDEVYEASRQPDYKYKLTAVYEKTSKEEPGTIIKQDPEAGTKVLEGATITLTVAQGEDGITIPNVFGYNEQQAKSQLEKAGLINIKVLTVSSENVDEGKVIYTDPKANSSVSADTEVTIYVSTGPSTTVIETITVPDVYGLTQSGARAFLEKCGFTNVSFVTQDSPMPKDVVISQSPGAGEEAQATDSIKLIISSGTTTTTTEKQVKATVNIRLPKVVDKNGNIVTDTITISVDGAQTTKKKVKLDGSSYTLSVPGEQDKTKTIVVSLDGTKDKDTRTTSGKDNERIDIDFSGSSRDDHTTTTTTTKKSEEESEDEDEGEESEDGEDTEDTTKKGKKKNE